MLESFSIALIQCKITTAIYKNRRKSAEIVLLLGFFLVCRAVVILVAYVGEPGEPTKASGSGGWHNRLGCWKGVGKH
jgi:hypothetical protein